MIPDLITFPMRVRNKLGLYERPFKQKNRCDNTMITENGKRWQSKDIFSSIFRYVIERLSTNKTKLTVKI